MPRYKLRKEHYLQDNNAGIEPQLHAQGAEIDWAGTPSLHMDPLDQEATERVSARLADFSETKKAAMKRRSSISTGWSRNFEQNMERIITREPPAPDATPHAKAGSARKSSRAAA